MWWLNKDHRCRGRERKRAEANDTPRALQHMAHQSRVKPPHKLHALYIAICINKLLLSCSQALMHKQEGSVPLTNKLFYLSLFTSAPYGDPSFPHRNFLPQLGQPTDKNANSCKYAFLSLFLFELSYVLDTNWNINGTCQDAHEKLNWEHKTFKAF